MAEIEKEKTEKVATIRCHLKNPTPARRVIYDGINIVGLQGQGHMQKSITIDAGGETSKPVLLSRAVVEELQARNKQKPNSDLIVEAA